MHVHESKGHPRETLSSWHAGPQEPLAVLPPVAPSSGQLHLARQGHFANEGHPLSLLFWGELSKEKVLIWFPPSHCWFIYKVDWLLI